VSDEPLTLEALLENLGRGVVDVVAAPGGLAAAVVEPVIFDPLESSSISRGALVLAVGVAGGTAQAEHLLAAAAHAGAAGVIFKASPDLARLAGSAPVAILSVPEEMTWTQLHALLNLSRFSSASGDTAGIAGVPLGDLFALANAIAGLVGGAVTIEDPARRVLAYSNLSDQPIDAARRGSILGRQVPDSPAMRKLYRQVLTTPGVMSADAKTLRRTLHGGLPEIDDVKPRAAVAIRAGSQAIGSIWVVHDGALDERSQHALAEAARIAAPHMIQARAARDVERRLRAELLLTLLEGRGSGEEAAARLGFTPAAPLMVLAFELAEGGSAVDELHRERLVDLVVVHCQGPSRPASAVALGPIVYALLQAEHPLERRVVTDLVKQIQRHAEARLGATLLAAVGPTAATIREVSSARREAERVLGVLRTGTLGRTVALIDDVRSEVVLHELQELSLDHPTLRRGKLEHVLAYDSEHNGTYAATLRAYLDCFGDVPRAAKRISVHPNTFRYRIRRLVELFDLDLEDADERVVLELQLRLLTVDTPRRRS
jgi:DNA-binding PucR family transcriptional regulator